MTTEALPVECVVEGCEAPWEHAWMAESDEAVKVHLLCQRHAQTLAMARYLRWMHSDD